MTKSKKILDCFERVVEILNHISIHYSGLKESKLGTLKLVLLDLMKRMHSNLYALKIILPEFFEGNSLGLPIGLVMRTCVTDALTGFYLLTFSKDIQSLENELNVMGLDYISYLEKLSNIEPLFFQPDLSTEELETTIIVKLEDIIKKYPDLTHRREGLKIVKKTYEEIRATSNEQIFPNNKKYNGSITDLSKFQRLFDYPGEGIRSISYLYPLFRFYSQLHHYTVQTRKLMDWEAEDHMQHISISLVLILHAINSFGKAIEIPDELLLPIRENIDKIYETMKEQTSTI